jgi:hypothetical protein
VAVALVNTTCLIEVDVFLVARFGTTSVLIVRETSTGTILGVWESATVAVGLAIVVISTRAGTLRSGTKCIVVGTGVLATLLGATTDITEPVVGGSIPVGVKVDSLVGKAKVEILGVDHTSPEWIIGSTTEVGNINRISEVEVLWATVWEGGDEVNV